MKLIPYLRPMIWGGNALKTKFAKDCMNDSIGESWELTCRPEAKSVIANGKYEGQELSSVLQCDNDFPLLIKFIDAHDKLSVQVHPDDDITDANGIPLGKTEMWYILDADEDAYIIYGLTDGTDAESFKTAFECGDYERVLKKIPVKAGDCFFIPAGQVHAIGKGILLAEIQQNSDTTYRLYDYGRLDKDGNPRNLHIEKALKVLKAYSEVDIQKLQYSRGKSTDCLANCDKFSCYRFSGNTTLPADNKFSVLLFLEGEGSVICNSEVYPCKAGDTYYVPEKLELKIVGNTTFLKAAAN